MAQPPRPCSICSCATFHIIPNVQVDISVAVSVLGMQAKKDLKNVDWAVTLVCCTQCGHTQSFTSNAAQLAQHFPGSHIAGPPR